MGRALHRQVDGVVGVADVRHLVLAAGDRIGAGRQHGVDRIPAPAEQAGLRAVAVERNSEREDLAGADQSGRPHDILRRDVVERADLIVLAPAAPILELLGCFRDGLFADVDIHWGHSLPAFFLHNRFAGKRGPPTGTLRRNMWRSVMKLLSFTLDGKALYGALRDGGVVTMNDRLGYDTLRDALAAGAIERMREIAANEKPDQTLDEIKFQPAIPRPEKILCAGINYRAHAAETGRELPKAPAMFARFADTLIGHEGKMICPRVSRAFDFEGELAVVIGRSGRHISVERALDHVAGYTCFVDGNSAITRNFPSRPARTFPAPGRSEPTYCHRRRISDPARPTLTTQSTAWRSSGHRPG